MAALSVGSSRANPELPLAFDVAWTGLTALILVVTIVAMVMIARSSATPLTKALLLLATLVFPVIGALGSIVAIRSLTPGQVSSATRA